MIRHLGRRYRPGRLYPSLEGWCRAGLAQMNILLDRAANLILGTMNKVTGEV